MMLPAIQPMLAVPAAPFDAAGYCFEIKWDGVRTLAAVDERGGRLWGRDGGDYTMRYPELIAALMRWPAGTLVDGDAARPGKRQACNGSYPRVLRLEPRLGLYDRVGCQQL